jgi:predicted ArsR family transcriptional regulator
MTLKTSSADLSSQAVEVVAWTPRSPAERLLMALKMHGTLSVTAIGALLGISGEAARQHLVRLSSDGLVAATTVSKGVGRPAQAWVLTPLAQTRFPDTHAALTVQLLDIVRNTLGGEALDTIIATREVETRLAYEAAIADRTSLRDKVAALADIRSAEGYMAGWTEAEDGALLLYENHCPICAAATQCQGFCRAELQVFQAVLGPGADVQREEHIVAGGRRCSYSVRPVTHE